MHCRCVDVDAHRPPWPTPSQGGGRKHQLPAKLAQRNSFGHRFFSDVNPNFSPRQGEAPSVPDDAAAHREVRRPGIVPRRLASAIDADLQTPPSA